MLTEQMETLLNFQSIIICTLSKNPNNQMIKTQFTTVLENPMCKSGTSSQHLVLLVLFVPPVPSSRLCIIETPIPPRPLVSLGLPAYTVPLGLPKCS